MASLTWTQVQTLRVLKNGKTRFRASSLSVVDGQKSISFHDENCGKNEREKEKVVYPDHVETNLLQKIALTVGSGVMAISDPSRGDMVAAFGETTGALTLGRIKSKMAADPVGMRILADKPRITTKTVDLKRLGSLPSNTFGYTYANFMVSRGFSPDERPAVKYVEDAELAYVMQRYRECHDLFHVILGAHTNMIGEISVKWVEGIQLGFPMCYLGALAGPVRLGPVHMRRYFSTFLPWAIETGMKSKFLMNIYFEEHWEDDLEELRKNLNIEPAPKSQSTYKPHISNLL